MEVGFGGLQQTEPNPKGWAVGQWRYGREGWSFEEGDPSLRSG